MYNTVKPNYLGYISAVLYVVAVATAMELLSFEIEPPQREGDTLYIEIVEPKPVPAPPPPPVKRVSKAPQHEKPAPVDNSQQVSGTEEQTRTVNTRALFKMNKGGVDAPVDGGNPYAKQGEKDEAKGTGGGLNPMGTDALDAGLQGRGLVGALPTPEFPGGNRGGKVVIRVAVNRAGAVTEAAFEPKGSTTSDVALVEAAIKAAKKARFTESQAFVQGGTITYIFKLKT